MFSMFSVLKEFQANLLVKATKSSSFLRAAPLAMVSRALAMPAPIESARLAV